ncbi:phage portal protein [Kocuria sp. TGY1127_2]|uniref:phage portal protein n=1 Tax=Kocuria sp. TGY1127_2 TaxID=2711328 RepID=UPI0015BC0E20|nr:phage portal protein [Kocuria sp. TGY1127_2]
MGHGIRDGDIISLDNQKSGALTMSQPLMDYRPAGSLDPYDLWATQPSVRTVIGFIARSVASIPFHVYQGDSSGGKTIDPTSKIHQALHRPWPKQGQGRFIEALVNDLYIFGRWGFLAMPDGSGGYEFPKLKGNRFSTVVDGFGRYEGVAIWPEKSGEPEIIPTTDVVFDMGPEPIFGKHRYGSTSVATLDDLARELTALGDYRADLFSNGARVPAVIERPSTAPKWSDEAWGRFKTEFSTYKAGGGNAGGTPILEDGMTYRSVDSVSPKDAQYVDVRKLALEEAAEALHVPPELVGARQGTYSNILALREQLYQDVLGPLIRWTQEALNVGLAHLLDADEEIRADVDSKLRTDQATRAKIYQTTVGAPIQTVNEARAEQGWPAVDGGDELITPMNVTQGGLAGPNDTGQTNEPDPADPLPDLEAGSSLGKAAAPERGKADTADDTEADSSDEGEAAFTDLDAEPVQGALEAMTEAVSKEMNRIISDVASRLGFDRETGEKARYSDSFVPGRTVDGGVDMAEALAVAFSAEDQKAIVGILENHLGDVAAEASLQTLGELGADLGVWAREKQYGWLSKAGKSYAQLLVDDGLYRKLRDVQENGVQQVELRMTAILNAANQQAEKRINTIGTEVTSFGAADAAKAAKATHKTWHTTSKNPRASHAAQDGQTVPVDDTFNNGLRWPGDWTGSGPETAHCQCRLTYSKE